MHCEEAMPGCVEQMTVAECGEEEAALASFDFTKKTSSSAPLAPLWVLALGASCLPMSAYAPPHRHNIPSPSILKTTQRLRI